MKRDQSAEQHEGARFLAGKDERTDRKTDSIHAEAENRGLLPIDREKLNYCGVHGIGEAVPNFAGLYYLDYPFVCKDCGTQGIWTGAQQKWWYEEKGGVFESKAVRCHDCLLKERERKAQARRISEEGRQRKAARRRS